MEHNLEEYILLKFQNGLRKIPTFENENEKKQQIKKDFFIDYYYYYDYRRKIYT